MTTCPRCGSDNKDIRQYPYSNKNIRCRNGWHTVGTRTMPRYVRSALGSSPLTYQQDIQCKDSLPIIEALQQANQLLELVTPKLQLLLDNAPHHGISCRDYAGICQQTVLDIAKLFGVTLRTGEQQHG